nr:MAG TPA: hypothetical protein [Caudoviricetes sp.]
MSEGRRHQEIRAKPVDFEKKFGNLIENKYFCTKKRRKLP